MGERGSSSASEGLPAVLSQLADALDPVHDVIDTMDLLVHSAVRFTNAAEAGVVLADAEGVLHMVASTSERTSDVEEAQLEAQTGPCLDSYRTGETVDAPDLTAVRERWPALVRVAYQRGLRGGYSIPMTLRDDHVGAMNLFFDRLGARTDSDAAVARALAQFATIGIVQRRVLQRHVDRASQLQQALESRVLIEQAKGALAFQHGVSIDDAFTLLREFARRTGTRIRDVADQIVHRRISI